MNRKIGFGKYHDKYINEVPSSYLRWLILNAYSVDIRRAAEDEWAHRTTWGKHWGMPRKKLFA